MDICIYFFLLMRVKYNRDKTILRLLLFKQCGVAVYIMFTDGHYWNGNSKPNAALLLVLLVNFQFFYGFEKKSP